MEWRVPITVEEQTAFNEGLEIERYRAGRDTPAPYIPPDPAPEVKQDFEIQPRHVKAVAFIGGGLAIGYSVVAFVAAYAVEIGAVVGFVALVGLVVSGLKRSESGANKAHTEPPPGGSGEWEFYQRQEQGWRQRTS